MAYIEPTLTEAKVNTMEQKVTKTNKSYMLVNFADGLRASAWDQHLWPILMNAQEHDATLQVWHIRNNMGYNTITNLEPMPGAAGAQQAGNGGGGEHFIKGVGGQQAATPPAPAPPTSPAKPPAPAQRSAVAPAGLTQSDRVHLCLAAGMIAWGGGMIKNKDEYFEWLRMLEQYAQGTADSDQRKVLPGFEGERSGPAYQGPEYGT